jgi:hypothetical protein
MDFGSPMANAAAIAGAISLIVSLIGAWITLRVANNRAGIDEKLTRMKAEFDQELATHKARLDNPAAFAAESAARALLSHPAWTQRTFEALKGKLSGFDDDQLRKILVQAGAVCFRRADGSELWGLISRNEGALKSDP